MTDDRTALLAAIRAAPDDAGPRLAYADFLEDAGDTDRAAFIRLHVAGDSRSGVLLRKHRAEWMRGLPDVPGASWKFRRGFPECLSVKEWPAFSPWWAGNSDEFARLPADQIGVVRFECRVENIDQFIAVARRLAAPEFAVRGHMSPAAAACLAAVPGLRVLDLSTTNVTDADLALLAKCETLTRVRLNATAVGDIGAATLARLPNLSDLDSSNTAFSDVGLLDLAMLPGLRRLDVRSTGVTDDGLALLAGKRLRQLKIPAAARTDLGLRNYRDAVDRLPADLDLSKWSVTADGLRHLAGAKLRSLKVPPAARTSTGLRHAVAALTHPPGELDLRGWTLTVADLDRLAGLDLARLQLAGRPEDIGRIAGLVGRAASADPAVELSRLDHRRRRRLATWADSPTWKNSTCRTRRSAMSA